MTNEVIIVLGIVIATVVGIAISFFKTKSTDNSPSTKLTTDEELEQIKKDLEIIKQKLQDQVED